MQKYECASTVEGKHAGPVGVKSFALDLKARYLFSGSTALPSASSHQHTSQLAHGNPDTKQSASQITKAGMHWMCIHWIERAALSLAPREAHRSERQQACGHRLRCGCNTPFKICSNVNCERCRKISRKGKQCSSPGRGSACRTSAALCTEHAAGLHSHGGRQGEHAICYCKCTSTQGDLDDRCFWMAINHWPRCFSVFFPSVNHRVRKWKKQGRTAGKSM